MGAETPSTTLEDNHRYYTMSVYQNNEANSFTDNFINMENAEVKEGLSDMMVGAELVKPLFPFPFYGHQVEQFFITTHGFLSLSSKLHDYIYKTQYIAPLRIKLDPSRSNSSTISILSLPDRLTVEWSNVSVMQPAEHSSGGAFTFQVTLRPNGDIVFVYVEVQPVLTHAALYDHEPVAGISDAFLLHGSELHLYHKINIENVDINTRTVAVFRALPSCVSQRSCGECAAVRASTTFECSWCPASGHCSDGADRLRQAWDDNRCPLANTTNCEDQEEWNYSTGSSISSSIQSMETKGTSTSTVVSAVVSSLMVIILIFILLAFLFFYGKFNENTVIGRQVKILKNSYEQFGGPKGTSLELGKKKAAEAKARGNEFVNPHPMTTNNNVITASM